MANNNTIPPDAILNPYTPLAFLPPSVADQYQVMAYVYVATLAVTSANSGQQLIWRLMVIVLGLLMGLAYGDPGRVQSYAENWIQRA